MKLSKSTAFLSIALSAALMLSACSIGKISESSDTPSSSSSSSSASESASASASGNASNSASPSSSESDGASDSASASASSSKSSSDSSPDASATSDSATSGSESSSKSGGSIKGEYKDLGNGKWDVQITDTRKAHIASDGSWTFDAKEQGVVHKTTVNADGSWKTVEEKDGIEATIEVKANGSWDFTSSTGVEGTDKEAISNISTAVSSTYKVVKGTGDYLSIKTNAKAAVKPNGI